MKSKYTTDDGSLEVTFACTKGFFSFPVEMFELASTDAGESLAMTLREPPTPGLASALRRTSGIVVLQVNAKIKTLIRSFTADRVDGAHVTGKLSMHLGKSRVGLPEVRIRVTPKQYMTLGKEDAIAYLTTGTLPDGIKRISF